MPSVMKEQLKIDSSMSSLYRPPQQCLDLISDISETSDDSLRTKKVVELNKLINEAEDEDQLKLLDYCSKRLVKGLSSNRKFARVGYATALTHLLREHESLATSDVLKVMKIHLQVSKADKQSEAKQIILGKAFGLSSLIRAGRLVKTTNDELEPILDEITTISKKKPIMKPTCNTIVEDLIKEMSGNTFGECVWPRIRDLLKDGWEGCTLDKLALVLAARASQKDFVTKKFIKKHFGYPVFSIENDEKLIKSILGTVSNQSDTFSKKILPFMLQEGRTALSIWQGIGEPLISNSLQKKACRSYKHHLLGLKLGTAILRCLDDKEQIMDIMACPILAQEVFSNKYTSKNHPLYIEASSLFDQFIKKAKELDVPVHELFGKLWSLVNSITDSTTDDNTKEIITSSNFQRLMDLMEKEEAVKLAGSLVTAVKGKNKKLKLSDNEVLKKIQIESCLRCLQHAVTSQYITSKELQEMVMPLLLRLSFFNVTKKDSAIQHCDTLLNLEEKEDKQKLCKALFLKSLDQLSTTAGGSSKKKNIHMNCYTDLLIYLTEYIQKLIDSENVQSQEEWTEEMTSEWAKVSKLVSKIQKNKGQRSDEETTFLLLLLFLAFELLKNFKTSVDLLQEVQQCYKKTINVKKEKHAENGTEPAWQEVLTEVLLSLMSLESHLSRVVACEALQALVPRLTPGAVALITEVLIPKSGREDDADGAMVAEDDGQEEEDLTDDENELLDEDNPEEESDDDSDEEAEDKEDTDEDDEEEDIDVDEQFRASVKEALGSAADEGEDEDQELPDLNDEEMSKMDDMLAEIFRQRMKIKEAKKNKKEQKKQLAIFRLRVLDLVEVLVKSDRCGDFVLDLVRPLLILTLKSEADNAIFRRAKQVFDLLTSKSKGLTDSIHSPSEGHELLGEIMELAGSVSESSQVSAVSQAYHMIMNLNYTNGKDTDESSQGLVQKTLRTVIIEGKAKPTPVFFSSLIKNDTSKYLFLLPMLVNCMKEKDSLKAHGKIMCCSLMATLINQTKLPEVTKDTALIRTTLIPLVSKAILSFNKDDKKSMHAAKEMLRLAAAVQDKCDLFEQSPFGQMECNHLKQLKSKFDTDLKKLTNGFISRVNRDNKVKEKVKHNKKRKHSEIQEQNVTDHNNIYQNKVDITQVENTTSSESNRNEIEIESTAAFDSDDSETSRTSEATDNRTNSKRKLSNGDVSSSKKQRTQNEPYRRVKSEEVKVDPKFMNNSFEAKKGARGSWGERANKDLIVTKGKSFKHEKTKKKRGSYRGGNIDVTSVNSIKFDSDSN